MNGNFHAFLCLQEAASSKEMDVDALIILPFVLVFFLTFWVTNDNGIQGNDVFGQSQKLLHNPVSRTLVPIQPMPCLGLHRLRWQGDSITMLA